MRRATQLTDAWQVQKERLQARCIKALIDLDHKNSRHRSPSLLIDMMDAMTISASGIKGIERYAASRTVDKTRCYLPEPAPEEGEELLLLPAIGDPALLLEPFGVVVAAPG